MDWFEMSNLNYDTEWVSEIVTTREAIASKKKTQSKFRYFSGLNGYSNNKAILMDEHTEVHIEVMPT